MNILKMIKFSKYSYHRNLSKFYDLGFRDNYEVIKENDYCVISESLDKVVITFRGSDDGDDWKDNFKIRWNLLFKGKLPRLSIKDPVIGHVHKGFFDAWIGIKPEVMRIVREMVLSGKKVYTAGHSKGGTMAVHCGLHISMAFGIPVEVFTQGCPKIGKGSFVRVMKGSKVIHHRLVNGKDAVPRAPRKYMGFKHDCKATTMEDGWFTWLWFGDFEDHDLLNYEKNAKRIFG